LLGYNNAEAARFSFYMAIPILFGANVRVLLGSGAVTEIASNIAVYAVGFVVAFVSAYYVIRFLLDYLSRNSLAVFAWYRIALAVVLAVILII